MGRREREQRIRVSKNRRGAKKGRKDGKENQGNLPNRFPDEDGT